MTQLTSSPDGQTCGKSSLCIKLMFLCDNMEMSLTKKYCQNGVEIILGKQNVTYSGYQSHATFSTKTSRQKLSFGGHQSSPPP